MSTWNHSDRPAGSGAVDSWLFEPAPPERLAVLRILVGSFVVLYLLIRLPVLLDLAEGGDRLQPVGVLWWVTEPLPATLVSLWIVATLVLGVAFTAGAGARMTGPAFAGAVLLLTTYRSSWGQLLWFENLMVLQLLIVGFARSADAWSVDALLDGRTTEASSTYGWPMRLAALVTVATYVLAGVAKLRTGGLEWVWGDTLRNHIAFSAARLELFGETSSSLGRAAVAHDLVLRPLAALTVAVELAAPLALIGGSIRTTWVVLAWTMHAAIAALMFVVFPFPLFLVAFACFYRLERLPAILHRLSPRRAPSGR